MADAAARSESPLPLPTLQQVARPTVADQVFDVLQQRILTLELPPCTKISESEVSTQMGVSRQPVREAFKRLAKLGFLEIRPQSGTTVSLISEDAVLRARFIRTALETQTCRTACETISPDGIAALSALIDQQKDAVAAQDRDRFHTLDEAFHMQICEQAGVGYVWSLIHDNKAHMDRIRMLSLDSSSQKLALDEHIEIFEAIANRDGDAAAEAMATHLSRILVLIEEIKTMNNEWFTDRPA